MRFILFLIIVFGQRCFAQTSISIAPLVIGKAYFCSYGSDYRFNQLYSEQNSQYTPNPYYTFGAKKFSYRPSIGIGIQVELSLKDGKHRIGLEWASDASGTMSKTTDFQTANTFGITVPYKTYGSGTSYFQSGFTYNRISVRYHSRLTKQNSIINLYLVPELTLTFGIANNATWLYEHDTISMNNTYFHNDAKSLSRENSAYYIGQKSILAGIGLRADFKTPKHKKYLFSLDLSYKQGYKVISYSQHTTVIYDSGKVFGITDGLSATGSGLYFQLSRSFTLYKWKKNITKNKPL
jgi:hypothetical protein